MQPLCRCSPRDHAPDAVLLELVEGVPDCGLGEALVCELPVTVELVVDPVLEYLVERLEVDELRGVVLAKTVESIQHLLFDVVRQLLVCPQVVEPSLKLREQRGVGDG